METSHNRGMERGVDGIQKQRGRMSGWRYIFMMGLLLVIGGNPMPIYAQADTEAFHDFQNAWYDAASGFITPVYRAFYQLWTVRKWEKESSSPQVAAALSRFDAEYRRLGDVYDNATKKKHASRGSAAHEMTDWEAYCTYEKAVVEEIATMKEKLGTAEIPDPGEKQLMGQFIDVINCAEKQFDHTLQNKRVQAIAMLRTDMAHRGLSDARMESERQSKLKHQIEILSIKEQINTTVTVKDSKTWQKVADVNKRDRLVVSSEGCVNCEIWAKVGKGSMIRVVLDKPLFLPGEGELSILVKSDVTKSVKLEVKKFYPGCSQ